MAQVERADRRHRAVLPELLLAEVEDVLARVAGRARCGGAAVRRIAAARSVPFDPAWPARCRERPGVGSPSRPRWSRPSARGGRCSSGWPAAGGSRWSRWPRCRWSGSPGRRCSAGRGHRGRRRRAGRRTGPRGRARAGPAAAMGRRSAGRSAGTRRRGARRGVSSSNAPPEPTSTPRWRGAAETSRPSWPALAALGAEARSGAVRAADGEDGRIDVRAGVDTDGDGRADTPPHRATDGDLLLHTDLDGDGLADQVLRIGRRRLGARVPLPADPGRGRAGLGLLSVPRPAGRDRRLPARVRLATVSPRPHRPRVPCAAAAPAGGRRAEPGPRAGRRARRRAGRADRVAVDRPARRRGSRASSTRPPSGSRCGWSSTARGASRRTSSSPRGARRRRPSGRSRSPARCAPVARERVERADEPVHAGVEWCSDYAVDPFSVPIGRRSRCWPTGRGGCSPPTAWTTCRPGSPWCRRTSSTPTWRAPRRCSSGSASVRRSPATAVDRAGGGFETMSSLAPPAGRGWEYLTGTGGTGTPSWPQLPELARREGRGARRSSRAATTWSSTRPTCG